MSISIAAEVQQKRFWGFDGRGMPRPRKLFWKLSHKWCWESHSTGHQEAGNTSPRCGCACLATQAAQRLSDEGQFPSTRDHGEGKMSALRNSGGRMLAVQAESHRVALGLDSRGRLSLRTPGRARRPSPHEL